MDAAQAGQHQVQNDKVVTGSLGKLRSGIAGVCNIDGEPRRFPKSCGQVFRQSNLVFNQQYAHTRIIERES